ncbi:MAG: DUF5004 domain-containing protein [Flavobacteriales bacterium]
MEHPHSLVRTGAWALVLVAALFTGCKPEPEGELGETYDKVKGLTGTWQLTAFTQQDLNSPVKEVRDLSSFYIDGSVTPLQLTFNADRTYAIALERGRNYFGEGGTWGFDDDDFPSYIHLFSGDDTLVYDMGAMVREFDQDMSIEYRRECNGTPTVVYTFSFTRIN